MKETIKIVLLAVIAIAVTYMAIGGTAAISSGTDGGGIASASSKSISDGKTFDPLNAAAVEANEVIDNKPKTTVNFATFEHDFGTIDQDTENKYVFAFTNTGKEPLVIEDAKGSCGCTVPNYPKQPIPPGGTGEIEVVYKPGKQKDQQQKTVTVTANTEPKQTTLRIKADVKEVG